MTTNDEKIVNSEVDTTELLMEEAKKAEEAMNAEIERDKINTRLCYEVALQAFYDEEGIDADEEKHKKEAEAKRIEELNAMTYLQEMRYNYNQFMEDMKNPLKKKIKMNRFSAALIAIFRAIILIGLSFIIFMPIFEKISFALRSPYDIGNNQVLWIPEHWSFMNINIAYDMLTRRGNTFVNSIILSAIATVLQVLFTAIPGYAFARLKFKGSNILFYLVIASLAVPDEALQVARQLFYENNTFFGYNLIGKSLSIYVMTIFGQGVRSAIFIFLFRQAFRNLPIELEESAEIDGCGVVKTFWSVMLPNVKGSIVTVALFAFVWQYNDYYHANMFQFMSKFPLLTTQLAGSTETLNSTISTMYPELVREFGGSRISNEYYEIIAQTCALLMMFPLLIAYLFVQRLFVESVERSGLTGM